MTPTNIPNMQWARNSEREWVPIGLTATAIEPGFYMYWNTMMGGGLLRVSPKTDNIIETGLAKDISADIDKFLAARDLYKTLGMLHKRGVLLISYPGMGKSMTAQLIAKHVISLGGIALIDTTWEMSRVNAACNILRSVHPEIPICNIMEDIEIYYDDEPERLLDFLDGSSQHDCIVHIATTNFPEKLESRLVDRPGRFDLVRWVSAPEAATRRAYLRGMLPPTVPNETIEAMVHESEGLLLSHMREMICGVLIQGRTPKAIATDLKEMQKRSTENDAKRAAIAKLAAAMPPDLAKQMKENAKAIGQLAEAVEKKVA